MPRSAMGRLGEMAVPQIRRRDAPRGWGPPSPPVASGVAWWAVGVGGLQHVHAQRAEKGRHSDQQRCHMTVRRRHSKRCVLGVRPLTRAGDGVGMGWGEGGHHAGTRVGERGCVRRGGGRRRAECKAVSLLMERGEVPRGGLETAVWGLGECQGSGCPTRCACDETQASYYTHRRLGRRVYWERRRGSQVGTRG